MSSRDAAHSTSKGRVTAPVTLAELEAVVAGVLREALGTDAPLDPAAPFHRHGLDSLRAVGLMKALSERLGRPLSATLPWRYPTPRALASHLLVGDAPARAAEASAPDGDAREPVAIVGMACRYPGSPDLGAFWELLIGGRSAVGEVPADRWDPRSLYATAGPSLAGSERVRWGAFIDDVDQFDPEFFGVSPREARQLDPQQRLMLELTWHALEDARIPPDQLEGTDSGVWYGLIWSDYDTLIHQGGPPAVGPYTVTGNHRSLVANRVSYFLGIHGPSMVVDSACSSGLVTVHLAAAALRNRETSLALAGSVNLDLLPESALGVEHFGALSPDGRCYTFDARANGYVRGEGAGVVVLKRLSDALAAGDRVYAVVLGSAVNNDGASNGLTAPNPVAQEAVLTEAWRVAGVAPGEAQYVEAHGTGTRLGDPIEAMALGRVLGQGRAPDRALRVGSAKTNVGHLEGGAGTVGLIKTALCLHHRELVPSLNYAVPNPDIPMEALGLRVQTERGPWPAPDRALRAGVSSFGLGGTNAHVVLGEWRPRVVFVCPGQGAQWAGMGRDLLEREPVFREVISSCDAHIQRIAGWSLLDELTGAAASRLDRIEVSLPAIISIDIAIASLWRSWGVEPAAVLGHSTGEIAAACVAGALDLADTMRVICAYGTMVARQRGEGGMGRVGLSWEDAAGALVGYEGRVFRALRDSRSGTVLAGRPDALDEVLERLHQQGVFARRVSIDVSPHCPLVAHLLPDLAAEMAGIAPRPAAVALYSEVTGGRVRGEDASVEHWVRNFGGAADFSGAVEALLDDGHTVFLEVGPHALNRQSLEENVRARRPAGVVLPSLLRGQSATPVLRGTLATLRRLGAVAWSEPFDAALPYVVSARDEGALAREAAGLARAAATTPPLDLARSLATARAHLEHRAVFLAEGPDELARQLGAFHPRSPPRAGRVAFVFPGQGAQFPGMGEELAGLHPVFRAAWDQAWEALGRRPPVGEAIHQTAAAQASLFAFGWALDRLLASWGVRPELVLGHSLGEVTAAAVSGVLSLEDAARLVRARGDLMQVLPEGGAMFAVEADISTVGPLPPCVSVAAVNAPERVVLSGDADALDALTQRLASAGVRVRALRVSHAFHSARMEPMLDAFGAAVAGLDLQTPGIPLVSALNGAVVTDEVRDPAWWVRHVREPVRFMDALRAAHGIGTFVEVGPAALSELGPRCVEARFLPCVRRGRSEWASLLGVVAALHEGRSPVDWSGFFAPLGGRPVDLPSYPFSRRRYWIEPRAPASARPTVPAWGLAWRTVAPETASALGSWLLLVDAGAEPTGAIQAALRAAGGEVVTWDRAELDPLDPEALARRLGEIGDGLRGVLCTWGGSSPSPEEGPGEVPGLLALSRALVTIQAVVRAGLSARLWMVTRGAVSVGPTDPPASPAQAMIWGLGRVAALEQPEVWGGLIDLPAAGGWEAAQLVATLIGREDQVALRADGPFAPRICPLPLMAGVEARIDGVALITGGLGAIGLKVAEHLAAAGTKEIVLTSRQGAEAPGAAAAVARLEALGASARVEALDCADEAAVKRLVAALARGPTPLRGVFHAAGTLDDALLGDVDDARLGRVIRVKVGGARALDRATRGLGLTHFVLFSSITGVLGNPGQGPYAAASAALDALAAARAAAGERATSVDWGAWDGGGMVSAALLPRLERQGIRLLRPETAVEALAAAARGGRPQVILADVDWARYRAAWPRPPALLDEVAPPARLPQQSTDIRELPPALRLPRLRERVRDEVAAVLGIEDPSRVDPDRGFFDLGIDSLMAMELRERLHVSLGLALRPTALFDHPSVGALAAFCDQELGGSPEGATATPAPLPAVAPSAEDRSIAVVGVGIRLPGGGQDLTTLDELWGFLARGGDAVGPMPTDRWPDEGFYDPDPSVPGRCYTRSGAFLSDVAGFDATFFGISPREARWMDPQQRLLLETAWEALEDAGIVPARLSGRAVGVFVGAQDSGYAERRHGAPERIDAYSATGTLASAMAGRLAFFLGAQGPALTVDTACSSSLVALHLAVRSLREGECELALAGGMQVYAGPEAFISLSRMGALSVDGRCRTFSAQAAGYGRGEGGGVLVLQRLSDARRDGRRILALIRGSAVAHDGASSGFTVPSGLSQQRVLRAALADAGLRPRELAYVDAHGTGTPLGDPIEVDSLGSVFGPDRPPEAPLLLGAAKSNFAHLEAAAGVAGVLKVIASLRAGELPPSLHAAELNPHIGWGWPVEVVRARRSWPPGARRAGVSSFGISGTNAHVVVEAAAVTLEGARDPAPARRIPLPVSGKTPEALAANARRLAAYLEEVGRAGGPELVDVATSLAGSRTRFPHRATVLAATPAEAASRLRAPLPPTRRTRLAAMFSGQGGQFPGMGRGLYESSPTFREALERCATYIDPHLPQPLLDTIFDRSEAGRARLDQTRFAQPAIFALETALYALWTSWGVVPEVLVGHSVGELAAACAAGIWSLPDACRVVTARGALMQELQPGGMLSVRAPEERLLGLLGPELAVAAVNAPDTTVVAGPFDALDTLERTLGAMDVRTRRLRVSHAFHSPSMEPMLASFRAIVAAVEHRPAQIPIVAAIDGAEEGGRMSAPDYWVAQLRRPVRFAAAITALDGAGITGFLEIGPGRGLTAAAAGCVPADRLLLPTLDPKSEDWDRSLETLAALEPAGADIAWPEVLAPLGGRPVRLPTYAFSRRPYWLPLAPPPTGRTEASGSAWPLAGRGQELPDGSAHHVIRTDTEAFPWLADHRVYGRVVVPGAFHLAAMLAVAADRWPKRPIRLQEVRFVEALGLDDGASADLHLLLSPEADGYRVTVATRETRAAGWRTHAQARLAPADALEGDAPVRAWGPPEPATRLFEAVAALHVAWGPRWRWITDWRRGENAAFGALEPPDEEPAPAPVHPALLDNAFGLLTGCWERPAEDGDAWLPFSLDRLTWSGRPTDHATCELARQSGGGQDLVTSRLVFRDVAGAPVCVLEGFVARRAPRRAFERLAASPTTLGLSWMPITLFGHSGAPPPVITTWQAGGGSPPEQVQATLERGLAELQAYAREGGAPRVWVTRGAAGPGARSADGVTLSTLWGLARGFRAEHQDLPLLCVDTDGSVGPELGELLASALSAGEHELALRGGAALVPRLVQLDPDDGALLPFDGAVLVTGGLGALGSAAARWLARSGVRRLVLASRRGMRDPRAAPLAAEIEAFGAAVDVVSCDVSDATSVCAAVAAAGPLTGVVHAAGVLEDGTVGRQDADRLRRVLAARTGAWHLHAATADLPLQRFVMFSSAAGVLGNAGQSTYGAANVFLDALAEHRRAAGLPGQSIAWGPWAGEGMAARLDANAQRRQAGIAPLQADDALALLGRALADGSTPLIPLALDRAALAERADGLPACWRAILPAAQPRVVAAPPQQEHAPASGIDVRRMVDEEVRQGLGLTADADLSDEMPLLVLGLDSMIAIEIRNRLAARTGLSLPMALLLDHPTVTALTTYLLNASAQSPPAPPG